MFVVVYYFGEPPASGLPDVVWNGSAADWEPVSDSGGFYPSSVGDGCFTPDGLSRQVAGQYLMDFRHSPTGVEIRIGVVVDFQYGRPESLVFVAPDPSVRSGHFGISAVPDHFLDRITPEICMAVVNADIWESY